MTFGGSRMTIVDAFGARSRLIVAHRVHDKADDRQCRADDTERPIACGSSRPDGDRRRSGSNGGECRVGEAKNETLQYSKLMIKMLIIMTHLSFSRNAGREQRVDRIATNSCRDLKTIVVYV